MAKLALTGVPGTDTESEFALAIDNVAIDHSLITRARFYLIAADPALDSAIYAGAWEFTDPAKLICRLGRGDLLTGRYRGRLITHDADHPNGVMWDDEITITML